MAQPTKIDADVAKAMLERQSLRTPSPIQERVLRRQAQNLKPGDTFSSNGKNFKAT